MITYVWLGVGALVIIAIGAAFLYGRRSGRDRQRASDLAKTNEVKDAQLEAGNLPRDPASIAERLRKHGF